MTTRSLYGELGRLAHVTVDAPRCQNERCGRRLAEFLTTPYSLTCPRCKTQNRST